MTLQQAKRVKEIYDRSSLIKLERNKIEGMLIAVQDEYEKNPHLKYEVNFKLPHHIYLKSFSSKGIILIKAMKQELEDLDYEYEKLQHELLLYEGP